MPTAEGADGVVRGTITGISAAPVAFTDAQLARRYRFTLIVAVSFEDVREKKTLWENPALNFSDEYELASASSAGLGATEFLGQERPDAVLLDVDLVDGLAVPVAETLAALQVLFALVTGHHASPLDHSALYAVPRLGKPYAESELRRTLGQLIGR